MSLRFYLLVPLLFSSTFALSAENEIEPVHYAFSNYLGNGIYRTANQDVTLINLPFSYDITEKNDFVYALRLPMSFGFFNFSFDDIPELEFPDKVGTFTFTPGIQVGYRVNQSLSLEGYADIGFARNFTTDNNVAVQSAGVSALYRFDLDEIDALWVSRTYVASYNGIRNQGSDSYAALQTGIDLGFPVTYQLFERNFTPHFYTNAIWYFSEVNFFTSAQTRATDTEKDNISLQNSFEFGFTLKLEQEIGWSWAGVDTLGLGYRFSGDFSAIRLIFSLPI